MNVIGTGTYLRIFFRDDFRAAHAVPTQDRNMAITLIETWKHDNGLWVDGDASGATVFVPWHAINQIHIVVPVVTPAGGGRKS